MKILSHKIIDLTPQRMYNRTHRDPPIHPRSSGYHVQEINRYLAIAAGKLKDTPAGDENFPRFSPTFYPLLPALGVAWEDLWASLHMEDELLWQPGEWERDGIYGTPDGLMIESGAIAECKLNYKKHTPISEQWLYLRQGMAYCAMSGINLVEYHVCWALSDYMRPYKPVYDVTLVEFSEQEIETWFRRMVAVKEKTKPE